MSEVRKKHHRYLCVPVQAREDGGPSGRGAPAWPVTPAQRHGAMSPLEGLSAPRTRKSRGWWLDRQEGGPARVPRGVPHPRLVWKLHPGGLHVILLRPFLKSSTYSLMVIKPYVHVVFLFLKKKKVPTLCCQLNLHLETGLRPGRVGDWRCSRDSG